MSRTTTHLKWDVFLGFLDKCKRDFPLVGMCGAIQGYMGLRFSDASTLTWGDVKKKMIVLTEKKTGKSRNVPVRPELVEYLGSVKPEWVVDDNTPILAGSKSIGAVSIQYMNKQIGVAINYYGLDVDGSASSHLFRKTFGRRVYEMSDNKEMGLMLLCTVFRHSNVATTKAYLGLTEEEVQSVYYKL